MRSLVAIGCALLVGLACGGGGGASPSHPPETSPLPSGPITYVTPPPIGKLPLPQHDPSFNASAYQRMMDQVVMINNFALYQGGGTYADYLHDGIDFSLPNGTPLFSVKPGIVRYVSARDANDGQSVSVEDADQPGFGFQYTHLQAAVQPGQVLQQGQRLGTVSFPGGINHLHLNRIQNLPGGDWYGQTLSLAPNPFFDLPDALPPEFSGPLRYFKDASDTELPRGAGMPTLAGKVDVVVGMRDLTGQAFPGLPERLAPRLIRLSVKDGGGALLWQHQGDLWNLALTPPFVSGRPDDAAREVALLFKHDTLLSPTPWYQTGFTWWVVTNLPDHAAPSPITEADADLHWDTTALDGGGHPLFPNGTYHLVLEVTDGSGHTSILEDDVIVSN